MRILQLCYKPPYPPVDGGTLAIDSVTRGLLLAGCEVKVLTVSTDKHPYDASRIPRSYIDKTAIEAVYVDTRIKPLSAFVSLLCGQSYHVKRYISQAFNDKLVEILKSEEFDVVHVESVFLTPYVETVRSIVLQRSSFEPTTSKIVFGVSSPAASEIHSVSGILSTFRWHWMSMSVNMSTTMTV